MTSQQRRTQGLPKNKERPTEREHVLPLDKLNSPSHLAQLGRARQKAIKALKDYCGAEIPSEAVRDMVYSELKGVSLGDLVIEERGQSY